MLTKKQTSEFKLLRNRGIYLLNKKNKIINGKNATLMRARKAKLLNENHTKMCSLCKIFVSSSSFSRHKCIKNSPSKSRRALDILPIFCTLVKDKDYLGECIAKIQNDAVGNLIKETPLLLYLGERLYCQTSNAKPIQKRRRVNAFLRKLGIIYKYFKDNISSTLDFLNLFDTKNIDHMKDAINNSIKDGLSQAPMYSNAVKFCCDRLLSKFSDEEDVNGITRKLERYLRSFTTMFRENFKTLSEDRLRLRYKQSRKAENLPSQSDIDKLINYCETIIFKNKTRANFVKNFIIIRRTLCTLLTIDNSRRGN